MPSASTSDLLIAQIFFFDYYSKKILGNAFFLACDENPKVTKKPASLHKTSKETRDQARQLITVPALFYHNNVFEP